LPSLSPAMKSSLSESLTSLTCSHCNLPTIECEHSFDSFSRFLALTVSRGDLPKCLFLSGCLSVLIRLTSSCVP
jgi:hypothetical protein